MGDGVLVYFGYPQAHEDDAERAVRAGLELIQAVAGLKSGLVVVGDLIGSGAAQDPWRATIVGLVERFQSSNQTGMPETAAPGMESPRCN